jgi:hypothetical protein
MYPALLKPLVQAANTNIQQNFFDLLRPKQYTPKLNRGLFNSFNISEHGHTNCTDAARVFGDTARIPEVKALEFDTYYAQLNFWSCAFFPNLTRDFRESILPAENRTVLLAAGLDTTISSSANVTSFLSTCLAAWCDNSQGCATNTACSRKQLVINNTMLSAAGLDVCFDQICDGDPERVSSPDIAGVGVITSIIIQFAIALCGVMVLAICSWRSEERPRHSPRNSAVAAAEETLVIALDEFQRAQCCFAIAIDIASLIALYMNDTSMTINNRDAIALASTAGTLPTTLVLGALMFIADRHSPYTFWLTFLTWNLSFTVKLLPRILSQSTTSYGYLGPQPPACGMNGPIYVCGYNRRGTDEYDSQRATTWLSLYGMVVLSLWYFVLHKLPSHWRYLHLPTWKACFRLQTSVRRIENNNPVRRLHRSGLRFYALLFSATSTISLVLVSMFLHMLAVYYYIRSGLISTEWTFGQVVAVSVWLPTLLSFVNDCIYGPLRGRSNQLPASLQVVRTDVSNTLSTHEAFPSGSQNDAQLSLSTTPTLSAVATVRPSFELQPICRGANEAESAFKENKVTTMISTSVDITSCDTMKFPTTAFETQKRHSR